MVSRDQWTIHWSREVEEWYSGLDIKGRARADRVLELLADEGPMLGMPHSRRLGEGLRNSGSLARGRRGGSLTPSSPSAK